LIKEEQSIAFSEPSERRGEGQEAGQTWMEDIGVGRVVDDDALREVAVEERKVLHIRACGDREKGARGGGATFMVDTIFAKESLGDQLTRERVRRSGEGGGQTLSGSRMSRSGSAYLFNEAV
jgi:hypothetical protein